MAIGEAKPRIVVSFDIEEHDRIEAAYGLTCSDELKQHYAQRMETCTRWLLDLLAETGALATFYVVGQIARAYPKLIQNMASAGHEVASHSWDHQRVHRFTPETFREDLRKSTDAIEQVTGVKVVGFRAPTFSVMQETAWAIDILAEAGMRYDSSIFPVRHDRYGVPLAPRTPFYVEGAKHRLLELPPTTLRLGTYNLPTGGGGYFRLFPLSLLHASVRQLLRAEPSGLPMFYFHPWEFDPEQTKLPLKKLSKFRTYVGIGKSRDRLRRLLRRYTFQRAIDAVAEIERDGKTLPAFKL